MTTKNSDRPKVVYAGPVTMADAERFKKDAAEWARKACRSKETARAELVSLGICTPDGRLTERYGGGQNERQSG